MKPLSLWAIPVVALFHAVAASGAPLRPPTDNFSFPKASRQFGPMSFGVGPVLAPALPASPRKILVIMVSFPADAQHAATPPKGDIPYFKDMLFGLHPPVPTGSEPYPHPSLADLYLEMSGGRLTFAPPVFVDWFTAPNPASFYTMYDGSSAFSGCYGLGPHMNGWSWSAGAPLLAKDALDHAVAQGIQLTDFVNAPHGSSDQNLDADGVFILHAGFGGEQTLNNRSCVPGTDGGDLWSHYTQIPYVQGGVGTVSYLMAPAESNAVGSLTGLSPMGVWAHEFGHEIGIPDEFPYNGTGYGTGCYDLMGYGILSCSAKYTGDDPGQDPNEFAAWTRAFMGWSMPVPVTDNVCNRQVAPVQSGGEIFKVTPNLSKPAEYFLIEYRASISLDHDLLSDSSDEEKNRVCVYHIDDTLTGKNPIDDNVMCEPRKDRQACLKSHYGISVVEFDGGYTLLTSPKPEPGQCLASHMMSDSAQNEDLKPWDGNLPQDWSIATGNLDSKATLSLVVNNKVPRVAPQFAGSPNADAIRGRVWKYKPILQAASGAPYWSLVTYPAGMTIDADTGLIAWRVPKNFVKNSVKVAISVVNCGGDQGQEFALSVQDAPASSGCGCASNANAGDLFPFAILGTVLWLKRRRILRGHPC